MTITLVESATIMYAHCLPSVLFLAAKEGAEFHTWVDIMQTRDSPHKEEPRGIQAGNRGDIAEIWGIDLDFGQPYLDQEISMLK